MGLARELAISCTGHSANKAHQCLLFMDDESRLPVDTEYEYVQVEGPAFVQMPLWKLWESLYPFVYDNFCSNKLGLLRV